MLLTEEYCARLHIRAVRMIGAIRRNADIFALEAARIFGSQRIGDQVGALLAGAWALSRDSDVTPTVAADFISEQDWSEERALQESTEEMDCVLQILNSIVRTDKGDRSVIELIETYREHAEDAQMAQETLLRHGIRATHRTALSATVNHAAREACDDIVIASSHPGISNTLKNTRWLGLHGRILKRFAGLVEQHKAAKYGRETSRGWTHPLCADRGVDGE